MNDPSTRPCSWERSQSFTSTRASAYENQIAILCDTRAKAIQTQPFVEFHNFPRLLFGISIIVSCPGNLHVETMQETVKHSAKIYKKFTTITRTRRTTNIQQRINRWSSAGFFSFPFSLRLSQHSLCSNRSLGSYTLFRLAISESARNIFVIFFWQTNEIDNNVFDYDFTPNGI